MATKKIHRAFALSAAILFLLTSVGFTGAVIWQMSQENKKVDETQKADASKLKGTQLQGYEPVSNVSKLESTDLVVGNGEVVKPGATITAHYTGAVATTGKIFESSLDSGSPATFGLDQVIKGWTQGVPGMKVGGKRRLVIPAELAYGAQSPSADIPANSPLVFDIDLVAINK
jgi:FKBP-type peptidyl-prolyl cis-trans isomerase FkpA